MDDPDRRSQNGGIAAVGLIAFALVWVYGPSHASFHPFWILSLTFAHIGAGALIAKWRALLLPIVISVLSFSAPIPAGADSSPFGRVVFFEVLFGFVLVAAGVLLGRDLRRKPLLRDPDPWR